MTLSRPYQPADLAACLALFDSNLPKFFAPEERAEFESDLRALPLPNHPFLVLTRADRIVACGGLSLQPKENTASLSWGMVQQALHGQGLGTCLISARLTLARAIPGISRITLSTSQHTQGFYEGFGFTVTATVANGYGPGIDRYDMVLHLNP